MTKIVALVPARGGSKGIPNKNLKKIGGISLLKRSIIAAKNSSLINSVFVSSDSDEILKEAVASEAIPIKRPRKYAKDKSSTEDVLLHFCNVLVNMQIYPDILVYLQCTSPFTTSSDVNLVVQSLIDNPHVDCTFSALEDHSFIWKINEKNTGIGVNHKGYEQRKRRQDLYQTFKETGSVYAIRINKLIKTKNRFGKSALPVVIKDSLPFEIDSFFDLELARKCYELFDQIDMKTSLKNIKAVVFDFDGVMTNDKVYVNEFGHEYVRCSRADGLGVELIKSLGVRVLILTREDNPVVQKRADKILVEIIKGAKDKISILKDWAIKWKINPEEIIYIGNDINDLQCLEWCGFGFAPSDAHQKILDSGMYKLKSNGGDGVAREIAELLIDKN